MSDLGLFTPENPVTYYDPLAAYIAAHARPTPGTCDFPGALPVSSETREALKARGVREVSLNFVAYGLPPSLAGAGLISMREWRRRHPNPNPAKATGTLYCNWVEANENPWVHETLGAILMVTPDGLYFFAVSPCLVGYNVDPWPRYDPDGTHICDLYQTLHLQDDSLQDLYGPTPDPLAQFGNSPMATVDRASQGPSAGLDIGGVNVQDALSVVNALTGGGASSVDLQGVIAILAALVSQGGKIRDSLTDIPSTLVPGFESLRDVLGGGMGSVASRLALAIDNQAGRQAATARDQTAGSLAAATGVIPAWFGSLVDAGGTILSKVADVYKDALDTLIAAVLAVFRDDIEAHAPVTPETVAKVAAGALRSALTAGSVAQLAGMGLELLHPLKNMGVQQAIGVIAEFAGFGEIAKPFFGATLRYGIGLPAEHRAAAHFRSVLPPVGDVKTLAAKGIIGADKYHDRLVLQGYPDPFPEVMVQDLYTELTPRSLSAFMDGSEADRPWLAAKLRYAGLSPEDTEKIVTALELKATQPGRARLTSAFMDDFKKGRITGEELDAGLASAGLSPSHLRIYGRVAELERRAERMESVGAEVVNQYRNDVVGGDVARQLLTGLGFESGEIATRLTVADLKKGLKQVQDETKDIEAEIRALKSKGLTNATRQLRAGFLDLETFFTVGEGMGYTRAFLQNVADVAVLQGPPGSNAGEPAIGEGALQETRQRIADLIAREVQLKRSDRVSALVSLMQLGIPLDLGEVLVGLAEAIGGPSPLAGGYGMPAGGKVAGAFGDIGRIVLAGLGEIKAPSDLVAQMLSRLGLPARDRNALVRIIRDVRDLFRL